MTRKCPYCGGEIQEEAVKCKHCKRWLGLLSKKAQRLSNEQSPREEAEQAKGFFSKLFNGDYGLARTYWLYGGLVNFIANISISVIKSVGTLIIVVLVYSAYQIVVLTGIWRASDKYKGPQLWAVLAKITVVLGCIYLALGLLILIKMLDAY